jgi:hypothetical protein
MPRLFQVEELEERKRALVEQSEIYRQTLQFELQNLRLYTEGITRKVNVVRSFNPLMVFAAPLLKSFFQRKLRKSKLGLFAKGLMFWRLYRQFSPLLRGVFSRFNGAHSSNGARFESVAE